MTEGEKKANKITWEPFARIGAYIFVLVLILLGAMHAAEASEAQYVQVYRGVGEASGTRFVEDGVVVVRGFSNYPVYEIRESESPLYISPTRHFFNELNAWRKREIRRKLYPRP